MVRVCNVGRREGCHYPSRLGFATLRRPESAVSSPGRISSYIATGFPPFSLLVANVWSRQRERASSTIRLVCRLPRGAGNPAQGDFHGRGNRLGAPTSEELEAALEQPLVCFQIHEDERRRADHSHMRQSLSPQFGRSLFLGPFICLTCLNFHPQLFERTFIHRI
jgi:hypothetical protein